jgi:gamma-glutamylputrescine oxidase
MPLLSAGRAIAPRACYADTPPPVRYPALAGDARCDVAIVGGGLTGLSAAIELAERGLDVALLEAREVGAGASGVNGGQAITGLACDQAAIEQALGLDDARRIFALTVEAVDLIRERCRRFAIDCDWRDGFLGVAVDRAKARALLAGADHLEHVYGHVLRRIGAAELPQWIASPRYVAAVHDARAGHLQPLKYTRGLAAAARGLGVRLHEDSAVTALVPGPRPALRTAHGSLSARQVLLAGNACLRGIAPAIEARIVPVRTFMIATEPLGEARARALLPCGAAVSDNSFVMDYFRFSADHRLLFGGGLNYRGATPRDFAARLRARMLRTFPSLEDAQISHAWSGLVDLTLSRAPDFGRLDAVGDGANIYYLQGFSGHGLALSGIAGRVAAEAIAGDAGRFDTLARIRHRRLPGPSWLRVPALALGLTWLRLKDAIG